MPQKERDEDAGYCQFLNEDGEKYGSCEIFWSSAGPCGDDDLEQTPTPGWYWWACFPGCMPDGDANGPFETSTEAKEDAQKC